VEGMEEEASLFLFVGAAKLNRMVGDDVALFVNKFFQMNCASAKKKNLLNYTSKFKSQFSN
jgi:hypothetical protein